MKLQFLSFLMTNLLFLSAAHSENIELIKTRCGRNPYDRSSMIHHICMAKNRSDYSRWLMVYLGTHTYLYTSEGFSFGAPSAGGRSVERYRYYGDYNAYSRTIDVYPFSRSKAPFADIEFMVGKYRSLKGTFMDIKYFAPSMERITNYIGVPID